MCPWRAEVGVGTFGSWRDWHEGGFRHFGVTFGRGVRWAIDGFVAGMETSLGRPLHRRKPGPPATNANGDKCFVPGTPSENSMLTTKNDAPILLLQWVDAKEYKETHAALKAFSKEVKIMHADVQTKAEAIAAVEKWLCNNANAQFLFIGTHGDDDGLGPTVENGVTWEELRSVLKKAAGSIALWLGACHSACAAKAWSPIEGYARVDYIVGFPVAIKASEIKKVLLQLLKMTGMDGITWVDQELPKLRKAVPHTNVRMHYKALTTAGPIEYVDFDEFPKRVGMTLKEYLEQCGGVPGTQ